MVSNSELIFVTAGFPEHHILAMHPTGTGKLDESQVVWRTTKNCSYVPSPISEGDYFLVLSDAGIASCFRAANGELQWQHRVGGHAHASLVSAEGLVFFTTDDGVTTVVKPGRVYEELARNELGEACYSSPAISEGYVFLRGEKHLFCLGPKR